MRGDSLCHLRREAASAKPNSVIEIKETTAKEQKPAQTSQPTESKIIARNRVGLQ